MNHWANSQKPSQLRRGLEVLERLPGGGRTWDDLEKAFLEGIEKEWNLRLGSRGDMWLRDKRSVPLRKECNRGHELIPQGSLAQGMDQRINREMSPAPISVQGTVRKVHCPRKLGNLPSFWLFLGLEVSLWQQEQVPFDIECAHWTHFPNCLNRPDTNKLYNAPPKPLKSAWKTSFLQRNLCFIRIVPVKLSHICKFQVLFDFTHPCFPGSSEYKVKPKSYQVKLQ